MTQDSAGGGGGPRHRFSSPSSFLAQYAGISNTASGSDQEMDIILLDHGYAKPWSAHPDASNARPLRYLFKSKQPRGITDQVPRNVDNIIDVEEITQAPTLHFDVAKARTLMNECERHASFARPDDQQEDWEEKLSKAGWTLQQNRVFTRVMKALQADRLARLTVEGAPNEPIARRLIVDKTAKRLRQALASIAWDQKIVQWLHLLILDIVSVSMLTSYLDALQTLKSKIPSLVERMTSGTTPSHPSLCSESLGLLLKRPWDPVGNTLAQQKPKKLPGNPLLLIAPSGPAQGGGGGGSPKDMKFWQSQLSGLGKVVPVTMHTVNGGSGVSVSLCLEHMIGAVRTKVLELKSHFPGRPIVLLGWNIGALVACHVSLVESVSAVVCLGFPLIGIHGLRGDVEDSLLDSKTPTLFVIGQDASDCSVDQMQDLREQMRAETGLVVVGGADEHLRLSHRQKRQEGLTQAMADRCIIDEVCQFLGSILSLNASLPETVQEMPEVDLRKKRRRKTSRDGGSIAFFQTPSATVREHAASTVRISKRGGKMSRQPAGSGLAFSTQGVYTQDHSRGSPRKRQGRGGIAGVPRKRLALSIGMNQLSVQVSSASPSFQTTAAAARPAHPAAIAATVSSAPELSGLLQGIRVSRASVDAEQVTSAGKSFVSASLPLTRLVAVGKLTDVAEGNGGSSLTTSSSSPGTLVVKPGEGSEKEAQSAVIIGKALHSSQTQSQQQILVRTSGGSLSTPITIPISMAHRLVGLGAGCPLVHVTGASSSTSSQIQQLLTSIANSTSITTAPGQPTSLLLTSGISSSSGPTTTITTNTAGGTTTSASAGRVLVTTAPRTKLAHAAETTEPPKVERPEAEVGGEVQSEADKVQAIQRLQFHDFPLTTASLPALSTASGAVFTQAKILEAGRGTEGAGVRSAGVGGTAAVMKVGVSKSLINPGSLATSVSSILSRVVAQGASQTGVRTGSPLAGTSILGGKSTVLITSLGKTLTSAAAAAAALGKMETSTPPATSSTISTMTAAGDNQGKTPSFSESISAPTANATTHAGAISAALQAKAITGAARMAATVGPSPGCSTNAPVAAASTATSPATAAAVSSTGTPSVRTGPKPHHSSYTSSAKPVLLTVASTRTRRIRTPKQYDL